jgi:hypothetical protein
MAVLNGQTEHALATPDAALCAVDQMADWLRDAGVCVGRVPAVGRIDLASDVLPTSADEGSALLRGGLAVDLPWLKAGAEGLRRESVESVYWRTGRSIVLRLYDKGVESKTCPPGAHLRLERQIRFRKNREHTVHALVNGDLRELYVGRYLRALLEVASDLHVCTVLGARRRLIALESDGAVSGRTAEQLAGFLTMRGAGLPDRTVRRRWAMLRSLGIALAPGDGDQVVPFHRYIRSAVDAWAA